MVTFVLDASAVLRFLDDEPGAEPVSALFQLRAADRARIIMSTLHFGEVIGRSYKRGGQIRADRIAARLKAFGIDSKPATEDQAVASGIIHILLKIPSVDSFGVQLTGSTPGRTLVTADFDFKSAEDRIAIEFLPAKPKAIVR